MGRTALGQDSRAITEEVAVAILVGMTVVVTATVGLNVLVTSDAGDGPAGAEFTYDHVDESDVLIVTHVDGDTFPAGELVIEGPDSEVTWAAAGGVEESKDVGPGDVVQIGRNGAYGDHVREGDAITVYHDAGENRTQLSTWQGD